MELNETPRLVKPSHHIREEMDYIDKIITNVNDESEKNEETETDEGF